MTDTETLNGETYELLLEVGRRLRKAQVDSPGYNSRLAGEIVKHGKAVAMFSAELRKAGIDVLKAAKNTSREERMGLAVEWLLTLPPELLRPVVEQLKGALRKRA